MKKPLPELQTGDIALWASNTPVQIVVRWATRQSASHAGLITVKDDGTINIIHAKYGWYFIKPAVVEEPLSSVSKGLHSIVRVKTGIFPNLTARLRAGAFVGRRASQLVGQRYDWRSIAGIILRPTGLGKFIPDSTSRTMCSELVSLSWAPEGLLDWPLAGESLFLDKNHSFVTPGDLLGSCFVEEVWNDGDPA
jgi:hypothetical protein